MFRNNVYVGGGGSVIPFIRETKIQTACKRVFTVFLWQECPMGLGQELSLVTWASIPIFIEQFFFFLDKFCFQLDIGFYCYKHLKISSLAPPRI